jgi:hypothetical protein
VLNDTRRIVNEAEEVQNNEKKEGATNDHAMEHVIIFEMHEDPHHKDRFHGRNAKSDHSVEAAEINSGREHCDHRQRDQRGEHLEIRRLRDNMMNCIARFVGHFSLLKTGIRLMKNIGLPGTPDDYDTR